MLKFPGFLTEISDVEPLRPQTGRRACVGEVLEHIAAQMTIVKPLKIWR